MLNYRLESSTKSLQLISANSIHVESQKGNSKIVAGGDFQLLSKKGSIRIEANDIRMPQLRITFPNNLRSDNKFEIFQLCICKNGKLFLAASESNCSKRERFRNCY